MTETETILQMLEYKIITSYYKFSMPFVYRVMVGYARHVNRYIFLKLLIMLRLSLRYGCYTLFIMIRPHLSSSLAVTVPLYFL